MRFRKLSTWMTALSIGSLAIAVAASAGSVGMQGRPMGLAGLERRIERLDVSPAVLAKAYAIVDASRSNARGLRGQMRTAHQELAAMLRAAKPDPVAIDAQVDALGALRAQQQKQYLHTLIQIAALLPDDQRAQWLAPHRPQFSGPR